jgi:DNA polymerase-3 subunit epsilon
MRQIILDTETTGLDPNQGHRIIEIGAVEMLSRRITGKTFHRYLNPEREVEAEALAVHGIDNEFLRDKPRFAEIAREFMDFLGDAELVIHNAPFDVGFINHELKLLQQDWQPLSHYCKILDTLAMARKRHPGQKNNLDALCKRYNVDNTHRELHGALLDAQILAKLYLAMSGGQTSLLLGGNAEAGGNGGEIRRVAGDRPALPRLQPLAEELAAHQQRLAVIDKLSGGQCMWLQALPGAPASSRL